MKILTCVCGRPCKGRAGLSNHARKCLIEQARSNAVVETVTQKIPEGQRSAHVLAAVRAARAAHPEALWTRTSVEVPVTAEHRDHARRAAAMTHGDPPLEERIARAIAAAEKRGHDRALAGAR